MNFLYTDKNKKNNTLFLHHLEYLNGKIYFKPDLESESIKFMQNNIVESIEDNISKYRDKLEIKKALSSTMYINNVKYDCKIIEKSYEKGLCINIEYDNKIDLSSIDKQKIAIYIEVSILDISFQDSDSEYYEDYEDYYEKKVEEHFNNLYDESDDENSYEEDNKDIYVNNKDNNKDNIEDIPNKINNINLNNS